LVIGYVLGSLAEGNKDGMESEIHFVEEPVAGFIDRRRKVWLECDGEPYDFRAVTVLGIRFSVHDIEVVKFICPRCGGRHQSLLFG
jgi:hypothetical protein